MIYYVFSYDYVRIYNGVISSTSLIKELTGNDYEAGFTITSAGTTVTINFISDMSERRAGFQIGYTAS